MKDLILLKLGGSLITDKSKPFTLRKGALERICREIHEARGEKKFNLIIGHGGGSFPHTSASRYQTQNGYINKESKKGFSFVQNDASRLNRLVVGELVRQGENAISIQPSASCIADKGKIAKWFMDPIKRLLDDDYIPVPFGDAVLDKTNGCCIISTEEILGYLAKKLGGKKIILAGKVDGVLDKNGDIVKKISPKNFKQIKNNITGSDSTDVTGGMTQKVSEMMSLTTKGIDSIIINGLAENNIKMALLGESIEGTIISQ